MMSAWSTSATSAAASRGARTRNRGHPAGAKKGASCEAPFRFSRMSRLRQELPEVAALVRRLDLAERRRLDLTHALAGEPHHAADLLERVRHVAADPKAEADDLLLAGIENAQRGLDLLAQLAVDRLLERRDGVRIGDEPEQPRRIVVRGEILERLWLLDD